MRWLLLTLFTAAILSSGCKKKNSAPVVKKEDPVSVAPGPGGGVVVNSGLGGGGGGGGAVQAVRGAVQRKAVNANQMKQIHTFIEYASGASGRMPSTADTLASLQKEAPAIAALVNDGTIVLNSVQSRESIWAYEAKALESSGWVCSNQGVETMDAATLKQRLGR